MRIGVTLPTFSSDAGGVITAARAAERAALHGVFSFDHQWPLGHPERPSLSIYPVLGAVAASTERIQVGTFVARVGLLPDEVVLASIESLHAALGNRLIAALGVGDEASAPEHERYGLPFLGSSARLESLSSVLGRLSRLGIECWVGVGSKVPSRSAIGQAATDCGASLNFWEASPEQIAAACAVSTVPVTWGGALPPSAEDAARTLVALRDVGAAWAVWGWPRSLDIVIKAANRAGITLAHDDRGDP
ncbi:MAG: LLM class flavin-dependent oxidoreductase [Acidimicrobiales bacterium]